MTALWWPFIHVSTIKGLNRDKTKITSAGKISAPLKCCCTENALMLLDPMKLALELKKKKGEKSDSSVE